MGRTPQWRQHIQPGINIKMDTTSKKPTAINLDRDPPMNKDTCLWQQQEKKEMLYRFNRSTIDDPIEKSFHMLVEEQAEKAPDRIAVVFDNITLTYRQLNEQGNRFAHKLREWGAGPDIIVGIMTRRSHHAVAGILAIMKSGGAFLPLDPDNPLQKNRRILADSSTKIVLTQSHLTKKLPGDLDVLVMDRHERSSIVERLFSPENVPGSSLNHLAYVIHSSGTAATTKGVMVTQRNFLNAAFAWRREFRLAEMEVNLLQLARFTSGVFAADMARVLINGGKMVINPEEQRFDPSAQCLLIQKFEISLLESTPAIIMPLLDHIRRFRIPVESLQLVVMGSETCPIGDFKRLLRRFGDRIRIVNTYGSAEVSTGPLLFEGHLGEFKEKGGLPVGKPMSHITAYIVNQQQQIQTVGTSGELCFGGTGVARGYLNNPELTHARFTHLHRSDKPDRIFKSGDLARWMPDGNIELLGPIEPGNGDSGKNRSAPRTKPEQILVGIFSEVLSMREENIGIFDSFFDIGGHSLKASVLQAKIHRLMGVKIPLAEIFTCATVSRLAQYIEKKRKTPIAPIKQAEKKLFYPLSYAQLRLFMVQKLEPRSIIYNLPTVMSLEGELNIGRMDMAFRDLVKRHESFRTSFYMVDKKPVQRVHREVPFVMEFYDITGEWQSEVATIVKNFIRPFDLSRSPLLRVGIIRIKESRHVLMCDMHHIIADGFSMAIFVREFLRLYYGENLTPLPVQYRDFAIWQRREKKKGLFKKQQGYWLKLFKDHALKLELPMDFPIPKKTAPRSKNRFSGSCFSFEPDTQLLSALNKTVTVTGFTLQHILLSVYYILLSRLSGQDDIVVGYPVNGRNHDDLQAVIGMFVNMLPLRNRPQGNKCFREFLQEVSDNAFDAFENQDYPFEQLVRQLGLKCDAAGNPLFNVSFTLQTKENFLENQLKEDIFRGLSAVTMPIEQNVSIFDLNLRVFEDLGSGTISFEIEYKTALFKSATVANIAGLYLEIARQVTADNDILLKDIMVSKGIH